MKKILVIPDQHIPYNDKEYWRLLMMYGIQFNPDYLIILGDFGDFEQVSSHIKDPSVHKYSFQAEIEEIEKHLQDIDRYMPGAHKVYIEGNHEDRLRRMLLERTPMIYSEYINNEYKNATYGMLGLVGYEFVPYGELYKLGNIYYTHDIGKSGKNAVNQSYDMFQDNLVFGHTHRLEIAYRGNARGTRHVVVNAGNGMDMSFAKYMKSAQKKDWQQGFVIGYIDDSGDTLFHAIPFVLDKFLLPEFI